MINSCYCSATDLILLLISPKYFHYALVCMCVCICVFVTLIF